MIAMAEKSKSRISPTFENELISLDSIFPSPENDKMYRPIKSDDPDIVRLADDIAVNGVLEPLVCTMDSYILSGHRRYVAAKVAGLEAVPVRLEDVWRANHRGEVNLEFTKLLASYNRQRIKDRAEMMREAIVLTDPGESYRALLDHREKNSRVTAKTISVEERDPRKSIKGNRTLADAAAKIIRDMGEYWPLSERQIHYNLLNNPPLIHKSKPDSVYRNDCKSAKVLSNVLTRMRISGELSWDAIEDPTRPTTSWRVHRNPQDFAFVEMDGFLKGYRRDLQQTQPLHIEVVAEKMTLESIIRPVCGKFNIPYTITRGYPSLPARGTIVERFRDSGKDKLMLLVLGDFDPEGINIGESLLQSLRTDFDEEHTEAVRVGLNPEHTKRFKLSERLEEAKEGSSRKAGFVKRFGDRVYELEALTPKQIQMILTEAIDSVLDADLFNDELEAEKKDAHYLGAVRKQINDEAMQILAMERFDNE